MENFGIEFNGQYLLVVNGNCVVKASDEKTRLMPRFHSFKMRGDYAEIWYQRVDGKCVLVTYCN